MDTVLFACLFWLPPYMNNHAGRKLNHYQSILEAYERGELWLANSLKAPISSVEGDVNAFWLGKDRNRPA